MKRAFFFCALGLVALGGLLFRTADLGNRPMHPDEANQAVKFGELLEDGDYRYDPAEHHGPSLYYLSWPVARLAGRTTLAALDERVLRLVPALLGAAAILFLLLFGKAADGRSLLVAAFVAAVSPVLVYYGRFYIQETLLMAFGVGFLASVWRAAAGRSAGWGAAAGLFAGLMFATKETSVLLFAAAGAALLLVKPWRDPDTIFVEPRRGARLRQVAAAAAAFAVPAALLYSSFLSNPGGIIDSVLSFGGYFQRAGDPGAHAHPVFYYFKSLAFVREGRGPVWTEALVLALAAVGGIAAFRRKSKAAAAPMRFVAVFSLLAAALYSVVPYKTPWNVLPFYAGFVILAGEGAVVLLGSPRRKGVRLAASLLLAAGLVHLGAQSYRTSFRAHSDPRNPWVYAQTGPDLKRLVARLESLSRARPEGRDMLIKVVASPSETWPLPWHLRSFRQVGYWTKPEDAGGFEGVPAVICSVEAAQQLDFVLDRDFRFEFFGLRPGVLVCLFVAKH